MPSRDKTNDQLQRSVRNVHLTKPVNLDMLETAIGNLTQRS